jgi:hypothetical protein
MWKVDNILLRCSRVLGFFILEFSGIMLCVEDELSIEFYTKARVGVESDGRVTILKSDIDEGTSGEYGHLTRAEAMPFFVDMLTDVAKTIGGLL